MSTIETLAALGVSFIGAVFIGAVLFTAFPWLQTDLTQPLILALAMIGIVKWLDW